MRILGIDPGYATTGFGILEAGRGSVQLLNYGTITPHDAHVPRAARNAL